ncbi:acetyl-CoA carboxylase biotin carboxyl carrier protein [Oceanobacillus bengalensis]|uniref:Biotin carboxyl carrier protein of acetyl-CoA carboxylase n=1 Tax=Oceanobacillus bengalensis TaxID=1435466 RepID=A0A494Z0Z1_9BACI|nr:acetyl-CoA carboxylase biotin carboxyl carrier protein [Oceanobacillus bengalensis]RKQ16048.1 acetyl-CoA carboxylase biotin carboxyl carrier protein [Oceanobacillus bengalensis]
MLKVQEIRELIKLIDQSNIEEFTYESDGTTVSMKKTGSTGEVVKEVVATPVERKSEPATASVESVTKEETVKPVKPETVSEETPTKKFDYEITSPMVGTFYSSPTPEADPYVSLGSNVGNDTVVCIVEAMKLFNEIEAEVSGEIVEVLVENGELVEYGQPLYRVKTK